MENSGSIGKKGLQLKVLSRYQAGLGNLFFTNSKRNNNYGAYSALGGGGIEYNHKPTKKASVKTCEEISLENISTQEIICSIHIVWFTESKGKL